MSLSTLVSFDFSNVDMKFERIKTPGLCEVWLGDAGILYFTSPFHIHSTGISSWPTVVQSSWWRLWSVFMAHTVFKDPYPSIMRLSI